MCSCTIVDQGTSVWRGPLVISCRRHGISCQGPVRDDQRSSTALSVSVPKIEKIICRSVHKSEKMKRVDHVVCGADTARPTVKSASPLNSKTSGDERSKAVRDKLRAGSASIFFSASSDLHEVVVVSMHLGHAVGHVGVIAHMQQVDLGIGAVAVSGNVVFEVHSPPPDLMARHASLVLNRVPFKACIDICPLQTSTIFDSPNALLNDISTGSVRGARHRN